MFELINNIEVDRKNSLPVADLHARYRSTGIPVIFGDLTKRWQANARWTIDYLAANIGDIQVPIYSNMADINGDRPFNPVLRSRLEVYLDELLLKKNDLRVPKLLLNSMPNLEKDFSYPRLGFNFNKNFTSLGIGAKGSMEPMMQLSSISHTVHCNFGGSTSVLLIPPELSGFMYRVGNSKCSVRDIDFDQPQFDKYPALKKLSGYVAELSHGDALYIPAGFWYCVAYQDVGISLTFEALTGSAKEYAGTMKKSLMSHFIDSMPYKEERLRRLEKRTIIETNARLLKRQAN